MTDTVREKFERFIFDSSLEDDCQKSPRTYEYENMERDWLIWQAAQADARALVGELVSILQGGMDEADGCELNMSNYHHDNVDDLNNGYVVLFQTSEQALTKAQAFMEGKV